MVALRLYRIAKLLKFTTLCNFTTVLLRSFRRYTLDEVGAGQQRVPDRVSRLAVALVFQLGNGSHCAHDFLIEFFGSYACLVSEEVLGGGEVVAHFAPPSSFMVSKIS